MKISYKTIIAMLLAVLLAIGLIASLMFHHQDTDDIPGYIETNLTYISSQVSGRLKDNAIAQGDYVKKGQTLFTLENKYYEYALNAAIKNTKANEAKYKNMLTGAREPKIEEIKATISQQKAKLDYLKSNFIRSKELHNANLMSRQEYESNEMQLIQAEAELQRLNASLVSATLPARPLEISNAKALSESASDQVNQAQWYVDQETVRSPVDAIVFDTLYWPGELVNTGQPVISLIVPDQVKLIFFIEEPKLSQIRLNDKINFSVDGVKNNLIARVTYISDQPEYTPPIIYSESSRQSLVFKVEAKIPANQGTWHPGQPVTVHIGEG